MKNFLMSSLLNVILILISYFLFRFIINGSTRHKIYENLFSSFAKFVVFIFLITLIITGVASMILYRSNYISYINIVAPALVSIFIGFLASTLPTKAAEDKNE